MKKRNALLPHRGSLAVLGVAALGYLWFYILEQVVQSPRYVLYIPLDDYIPFVPEFVIFYGAWYLYLLIPAAVLFFRDKEEFLRYAAFVVGSLYIACFIYTFWPNGIELRPDLTGATGPFNAVIRLLYEIDTPTNSAPSLHVAQSVAAHAAIVRFCRRRGILRWMRSASLVLCILIIASTVCIKQHSAVDILWGLLLALFLGIAVYGRDILRAKKKSRRTPSMHP